MSTWAARSNGSPISTFRFLPAAPRHPPCSVMPAMYQYAARFQDFKTTAALTWRRLAILAAVGVILGLALTLLTPLPVS